MDDLLTRIFGQQGLLAFIVPAVLLMIAEVGYRLGRRLYLPDYEAQRRPIEVVQADLDSVAVAQQPWT